MKLDFATMLIAVSTLAAVAFWGIAINAAVMQW